MLTYLKGYHKEAVLAPLFKLLEASFELAVPLIMASMMDNLAKQRNPQALLLPFFLLIGLALLGGLMAVTAQYYAARAAIGYTSQLHRALFRKILTLSQTERDQVGLSSLIARMTTDTLQIQTGINLGLRLALRSPFMMVGALVMSYRISPKISLLFLLMLTLISFLIFGLSRYLEQWQMRLRQRLEHLMGLIRNQLQGMRVIRAFVQEGRELTAFEAENRQYTQLQLSLGAVAALLSPLTVLVVNLTAMILIWQGSMAIASHQMSQGLLIALITYLWQLLAEWLKLTSLITSLTASLVSVKRLRQLFDRPSEADCLMIEQDTSEHLLLVAKDLTFTYPDAAEPALQGINLSLRAGTSLGIVGGTGAGKTTLLHLLCRLYAPQEGQLSLFYRQKSLETLTHWWSLVSLVPQKAELFKGTVRDNLVLGLIPPPSDTELWEALELAQIADVIRLKSGQLDAPVAAFGRNFSGGQRQRLTIARSLLRRPEILLLDDATSALDTVTERRLLMGLRQAFSQKTLIIVSQKIATLEGADQILVLDKGVAVALGTHEQLLATCALYRDLLASQQADKEVIA